MPTAARTATDDHVGDRGQEGNLLHLIEENARHNGHLYVIRELLDGTTGV